GLRRMDANGTINRTIVRNAPWFPARERDASNTNPQVVKPLPKLITVTELENSLIATVIAAPVRSWRPGRFTANPAAADTLYESLIEIIDTAAGRVVTSGYVTPFIVGTISPGLLYSRVTSPEGFPFIDVWRVKVVRP